MATIANLGVSLTARIGNFEKGFKRAQKIVDKHTQGTQAAAKFAVKWGSALVGAASAGLALMIRRQTELVGALDDTSQAIGIQVENLQALTYMAGFAGMNSEKLISNIERMSGILGDLSRNGGATKDYLESLGVDFETISRLSPDKQLLMLAAAFGKMKTASEQVAAAKGIFGRGGTNMLIMLRQLNEEGLDPAIEKLQEMGAILSDVDVQKIAQAGDSFHQLSTMATGVANRITAEVAPALTGIVNELTAAAIESNFFGQNISNAFQWAVKGAGVLYKGFMFLRIGLKTIEQSVYYFGLVFNKVFEWINRGFGALVTNIAGNINTIIGGLNKLLPKDYEIDLLPAENYFTQVADEWKNGADYFSEKIAETQGELTDIMERLAEFPGFEGWVEKVKQEQTKLAEEAAARNRAMLEPSGALETAAKTAEFRQVDLSRIAIGGPGGRGGAQKVEDPQLKTTNAILTRIESSLNSPLVTA